MADENAIFTFGWLFERRRAVQIYVAAINSTIAPITQRKCEVIPLSESSVRRLLLELRKEGHIHVIGRTNAGKWYPGPMENS